MIDRSISMTMRGRVSDVKMLFRSDPILCRDQRAMNDWSTFEFRRPAFRIGKLGAGVFLMALVLVGIGASCLEGAEASYRFRGGDLPLSHSVNGYSQSVEVLDDGEVVVRVGVSPVAVGADFGGFEPNPEFEATLPDGFGLPDALKLELTPDLDAYERATRVLRWIRKSISLDVTGSGNQDAVSVLERGCGRCSGLANAAAALLRAAGFQARTISGILISDDRVIPHRWLECYLPGAGWVPSDPTMGFWVVSPRHVVFSDTVTRLPEVDVLAAPAAEVEFPLVKGVPTRPDVGSELVCRVLSSCEGELVAVLSSDSGVAMRTRIEKLGRFSGFLPGWWRLEILRDGWIVSSQALDLRNGASHSIAVRIDDQDCD